MREHKFKVWLINNNNMEGWYYFKVGEKLPSPRKSDIYEFMGITDDDNIDMYDGDILNNEVEVYWNNNWNAFCVRKLGNKILYEFLYKYIINNEIKITNNVYENPL